MIYLVVKEEGVYSDWSKENICYFTTREEAEDYVVCMERLVTDTHRSEVSYDVEEIRQMVLPSEEEQEKKVAQAAHVRQAEQERRELEKKKKEAEAVKQEMQDEAATASVQVAKAATAKKKAKQDEAGTASVEAAKAAEAEKKAKQDEAATASVEAPKHSTILE